MHVPKPVSRREFLRLSGLAAGLALSTLPTMGRAADPSTAGRDADTVLAHCLRATTGL